MLLPSRHKMAFPSPQNGIATSTRNVFANSTKWHCHLDAKWRFHLRSMALLPPHIIYCQLHKIALPSRHKIVFPASTKCLTTSTQTIANSTKYHYCLDKEWCFHLNRHCHFYKMALFQQNSIATSTRMALPLHVKWHRHLHSKLSMQLSSIHPVSDLKVEEDDTLWIPALRAFFLQLLLNVLG